MAQVFGPTQIDAIVLDALVSESPTSTVEVTQHPIEDGSPITDHARQKPDTLSIEGVVSDTPLGGTKRRRVELAGGQTIDVTDAGGRAGLSTAIYHDLRKLQSDRKRITVRTSLRVYENMIITSLGAPRNAKTGDAVVISMALQEARYVKSEVVKVVVATDDRAHGRRRKPKGTPFGLLDWATGQGISIALGQAARNSEAQRAANRRHAERLGWIPLKARAEGE